MDKEKIQKEVKKQAVRKTKRTAKKKLRRIHPLSFVIWFLALAIGLGAGAGAYAFLCRNDGFEVVGEKDTTLPKLSEEGKYYEYADKGVKIVSRGKDISDRVKVETNMTEIDEGVYRIDASEEGVYYIVYTVDDVRFGEIRRVRTITVGGDE